MKTMIRRKRMGIAVSLCLLIVGVGGTVGCNSQDKSGTEPAATNAATAGGAAASGPKGPTTAGPIQNVNGQKVQKGPASDP